MEWLPAALTATSLVSITAALVYFYLYHQDQERYLLIWGAAWLLYSSRFVLHLLMLLGIFPPWAIVLQHLTSVAGALLFLHGTYLFMNLRLPRPWIYTGALSFLWAGFGYQAQLSFLAAHLPADFFIGAVFAWTGYKLLTHPDLKGPGVTITGWVLILWGLHKADYPFLRPVVWFAPWGYLLASELFLIAALGVMLIYHEKVRRGLVAEMEERCKAESRGRESERKRTEQLHLLALASEVGTLLSRGGPIIPTLHQCCEALVRHLDAAFARIWVVNLEEQILELKASAGMYTHLDGKHGRIPLGGKYKIGFIAASKKPHLTNSLLGDPLISDQEWVRREKMASFAGHPLMVEEKVIGVMALFARHPMTETVSKALASVADGIAMGIERKRYEEALSSSETTLKTLVNTIPDLVWLKDPNGVYLACNRKFERAFDAREAEIIGKTDYDFVDRELADFFRRNDQAAIDAGRPCTNEEEFTYADDGHREILETIKTPMMDAQGRLIGVLGVARDITERKKAAATRESLEKQLRQAQKMEAIGTLAGGIAHDFNNILSAILGYGELVAAELPAGSDLKKDQEEVLRAGKRAKDLVKQILTFSRQAERELQPIQIHLVIKEALKMLRSSIPTTIEIKQNIQDCGAVLVDPTQIHQVIMNLCTNAYHAMRETGGVLSVSLTELEITPEEYAKYPELRAGAYVKLEVSDTGHGIPPEVMERIFEPYFTTKKMGEGTGLGLAVVHGIVQSHGGQITCGSRIGQGHGTTFRVYLPEIEGGRPAPEEPEVSVPGGREHVLVVDDEGAIVDIFRKVLEKLGYRVTGRMSSVEALQLFRDDPQGFDLVITDMTMPRMTGAELAGKLMEIRPGLPVIMCSGYSDLMNEEKARAMGIRQFIMKPVVTTQIAKAVRQALDGKEEES